MRAHIEVSDNLGDPQLQERQDTVEPGANVCALLSPSRFSQAESTKTGETKLSTEPTRTEGRLEGNGRVLLSGGGRR